MRDKKFRPLGFHQSQLCRIQLCRLFDLFQLMYVEHKLILFTSPLWLPFYLMAHIWIHIGTAILGVLRRTSRSFRI